MKLSMDGKLYLETRVDIRLSRVQNHHHSDYIGQPPSKSNGEPLPPTLLCPLIDGVSIESVRTIGMLVVSFIGFGRIAGEVFYGDSLLVQVIDGVEVLHRSGNSVFVVAGRVWPGRHIFAIDLGVEMFLVTGTLWRPQQGIGESLLNRLGAVSLVDCLDPFRVFRLGGLAGRRPTGLLVLLTIGFSLALS